MDVFLVENIVGAYILLLKLVVHTKPLSMAVSSDSLFVRTLVTDKNWIHGTIYKNILANFEELVTSVGKNEVNEVKYHNF
jgi:hypothetical protein